MFCFLALALLATFCVGAPAGPHHEHYPLPDTPAVLAHMTESAWEWITEQLGQSLDKMFISYEKEELTLGDMTLKKIKVTKFDSPTYSHSHFAMPPTTAWKLVDGKITMGGTFEYEGKEGDFTWEMGKASGEMNITLYKTKEDKLALKQTGCATHIGDSVVTTKDSGVKDHMTKMVPKIMEKKLCECMEKVVYECFTKHWGNFPYSWDITTKFPFRLSYKLTSEPTMEDKVLTIPMLGGIFWEGTEGTPFKPTTIPSIPEEAKGYRYVVQGTDYILNSFMWAAYKNDLMKYKLDKETLGTKYGAILQTTCEVMCVGKLSNELATKYPDTTMYLTMGLWDSPISFHTTTDGTKGTAPMWLKAWIQGHDTPLATAYMTLKGSFDDIKIVGGNHLTGDLVLKDVKVEKLESELKDLKEESIEELAKLAFLRKDGFMQKAMDRFFGRGFPLPVSKKWEMEGEPLIMLQEGGITIGLNPIFF